ncbi:hypothetical protein [Chryseobacterium foetidum]|uniref:hypothetical protein n=1 Tax=Chryseobacterium foetidum TaxID=2951057 RepID=UPI0021C614D2|nr:hypothetical protein [Chryseobacterium foetidum]
MKKYILIVTLATNGIVVTKAQDKLEQAGLYNSEISTIEKKTDGKTLVFFPMKHAGIREFYNNVKSKIDSLKKEGLYFLYEKVKVDANDENMRRKLKKITGNIPISVEKGYVQLLRDYGIFMREELFDQPSYSDFGLDESNSENLDVTGLNLVDYYERTYGEIRLNKCEMETPITAKDNCKGKILKKKHRDDVILTFRNKIIASGVLNESHTKIALIYGEGHIKGIFAELDKNK